MSRRCPRGSRCRRRSAVRLSSRGARSRRRAAPEMTCPGLRLRRNSPRAAPAPWVPPAARSSASASFVTPLGERDGLEREGLLVEDRRLADPGELPRGHVGEALVVHEQVRELQEVRHAARPLERLVELLALAGDPDVAPELLAEGGDPLQGGLQALLVARHAALLPQQLAELAVEGLGRPRSPGREQLADAFFDLCPS